MRKAKALGLHFFSHLRSHSMSLSLFFLAALILHTISKHLFVWNSKSFMKKTIQIYNRQFAADGASSTEENLCAIKMYSNDFFLLAFFALSRDHDCCKRYEELLTIFLLIIQNVGTIFEILFYFTRLVTFFLFIL